MLRRQPPDLAEYRPAGFPGNAFSARVLPTGVVQPVTLQPDDRAASRFDWHHVQPRSLAQNPDVVTLTQHFRNHGYHTQAIGKIFHGVFRKAAAKQPGIPWGIRPVGRFRQPVSVHDTISRNRALTLHVKSIVRSTNRRIPDRTTGPKSWCLAPLTNRPTVYDRHELPAASPFTTIGEFWRE